MLNTYFKDRLVCIILLLYVVVLYYRLSCLHWLCVNLKIQLTFHVICLLNACYKHFPICIVCLVFIGCSVLSTILSALTSCNSYYPVDMPCNVFTEFLFQRLHNLHWISWFKCLFCIIYYLVYTDYTIHIDDFNWFPHWMSCLERLSCLHWLYWFDWLFCIIDYLFYTDFM